MFDQNGTVIRRCYFPRSIKEIGSGYMYLTSGNLQIFYCGEIVDLNNFNADEKVKIYVPSEKYALFKEVLSEYFGGGLLKANVSYCLNYDGNNYYYIDYYECGEKIMYIPPEPQRDGYSFVGWFKESGCLNRWDFEVDALQITEETQEIKLFAKWESVDK